MRDLLLYTTLGCHLCEQAEEVLEPVLDYLNRALETQDASQRLRLCKEEIADKPELMSRYGLRIPVVRLSGSDEDLGWPFDHEQAYDYLVTHLS